MRASDSDYLRLLNETTSAARQHVGPACFVDEEENQSA